MACILQLAAECGNRMQVASHLREKLDRKALTFAAGVFGTRIDEVNQDERGRWWISVVLDREGTLVQFTDSPELISEATQALYDELRGVRGYRYAIVGFEVLQFNDLESLPALLASPGVPGLVVEDAIFRELGSPNGFVRFAEGYLWIPPHSGKR